MHRAGSSAGSSKCTIRIVLSLPADPLRGEARFLFRRDSRPPRRHARLQPSRSKLKGGFQFDVAAGLRSWAFGLGPYTVLGPFSVLRSVVQVPRTKDGRQDQRRTKNQATKHEGRRYTERKALLAWPVPRKAYAAFGPKGGCRWPEPRIDSFCLMSAVLRMDA